MDNIDRVSVVIPSLNPSDTLVRVVTGLIETGFCDVIIIDDGSDNEHSEPFRVLEKLPQCTVLTHTVNAGKGAALKTALSFLLQSRPESKGVITADGDGQHLIGDVVKCARVMMQSEDLVVMGVRDFHHSGVPKRNSFGNRITAFAFRMIFGIKLRDTQTGLRGIPYKHIPLMLEIGGNRFEYETNMLLELQRHNIRLHEVEIETVYGAEANESSHYRPFVDSVIIFTRIFKYALSSVLSFIVDINAFWLALRLFGDLLGPWSIPGCTAIARVISSFFNFNVNRRLVFKRNEEYGRHLWRYYMLALVQMLVSAGVLWLLAYLFDGTGSIVLLTALKIIVDTTLFFLSYHFQRSWVFSR